MLQPILHIKVGEVHTLIQTNQCILTSAIYKLRRKRNTIYNRIVHMTAVLKSSGNWDGGFVIWCLHALVLGLYAWMNRAVLFSRGLLISLKSKKGEANITYSSPPNATKPQEESGGVFFGKLDSFCQRFKAASYLQQIFSFRNTRVWNNNNNNNLSCGDKTLMQNQLHKA